MYLEGEYDYTYFSIAKSTLKEKLNISGLFPKLEKIRTMSVLYQELDLATPALGFLEQNQIKRGNKRPHTEGEHLYSYHPVSVSISKRLDLITRLEIKSEAFNEKLVRQCTQCNRLAMILPDNRTYLWQRWKLCCPICSGRWKLVVLSH